MLFGYIRSTLLACSAFALAAACSDSGAPAGETAVVDPAAAPETPPAANVETVGGDGSEIELLPLTEQNLVQAKLDGELGCSFVGADSKPLLIAKGNVQPEEHAYAAVNNGGVVENLQSTATGGFDGMVKGATFGGRGLLIGVAPSHEMETGTEESKHAATLTVQRADGGERQYPGIWTCGP